MARPCQAAFAVVPCFVARSALRFKLSHWVPLAATICVRGCVCSLVAHPSNRDCRRFFSANAGSGNTQVPERVITAGNKSHHGKPMAAAGVVIAPCLLSQVMHRVCPAPVGTRGERGGPMTNCRHTPRRPVRQLCCPTAVQAAAAASKGRPAPFIALAVNHLFPKLPYHITTNDPCK
ncbi:hypothetical protein ANO11243_000090 [Dothideomycetidae sp. 11243]|nr:hypothetical protein ANO11243_000090 [fungal sp. No.11243]